MQPQVLCKLLKNEIEAVIFSTADADYYRLVLFRFGDNLSTDTIRHYRRRKLLFEAGRLLVSCVSRDGYYACEAEVELWNST